MRLKPFMPCGPYNRYNKSCQYLERAPSNQSESNVIEYSDIPVSREGPGVVGHGGQLYVVGGRGSGGSVER